MYHPYTAQQQQQHAQQGCQTFDENEYQQNYPSQLQTAGKYLFTCFDIVDIIQTYI
jgi:hypothetical protein